MTLDDVFKALAHGELSQVFTGDTPAGELSLDHRRQALSSIELGLTALYRRFRLKDGRVLLRPAPGVQTYLLDSKYALSNELSLAPTRYLIDSVDRPFKDDALRIEEVEDAEGGLVPLNDSNCADTLRTPDLLSLWLPATKEFGDLTVLYRTKHPTIPKDQALAMPTSVRIELPQSHLQALLYYVASRAYNPMFRGGEMHEGNNWAARYEQECQRLEADYLVIDEDYEDDRFCRNGWV